MFPVSHSRTPTRAGHQAKDFAFIKVGRTDLASITNRLGSFDHYYADSRVGYYSLNSVSAKVLWVVLPGIPFATTSWDDGLDVAMIQFDDRSRVRRFEKFLEWNPEYKLKEKAKIWASGEKPIWRAGKGK